MTAEPLTRWDMWNAQFGLQSGRMEMDKVVPIVERAKTGRVIRNVADARANLEEVVIDALSGKPIDPETRRAAEAAMNRMEIPAPSSLVLETTDDLLMLRAGWQRSDMLTGWLIRDHDRQSAEITRLEGEIAEANEALDMATGLDAAHVAAREAAAREEERQRCLQIIAEQRCERGTSWDLALVTAMDAIRARSQS